MENLRVYKLIKPTRELVEQFCSFWTVDGVENWMVELFENRDSLDIRDLIKEDDFRKMGENDAAIRALVQEKTLEALSLINAVYSTRVDADEITKGLQWEQLQENDVDWFVGHCKKKIQKNAYSFATKVYSFVRGETEPYQFPILDSIVVTLLEQYLKDEQAMRKKDWGSYTSFRKAYAGFVNKYELSGIPYKQIDMFLWTYGIALRAYWKKVGVLTFESVPYKAKETNE